MPNGHCLIAAAMTRVEVTHETTADRRAAAVASTLDFASIPTVDIDALNTITYTIGGMVLWPGDQIDGTWTINQARGCTGRIADHPLPRPGPRPETAATIPSPAGVAQLVRAAES